MKYEGNIFRPPSEAYSLLVQVTIGCSHNTCTFCTMYRDKEFRIRDLQEVLEELADARRMYRYVERIFLCDGDALCLPTEHLLQILDTVAELFPECERVTVYGNTIDVLAKTDEELKLLAEHGLQMVYLGAESGSDKVLKMIAKGSTRAEIITAVQRLQACGMKASVTFISGLGGVENWQEHAIETGTMITEMNAAYVGFMTLTVAHDAPMYKLVQRGEFTPLSAEEVMAETHLLLENCNPVGPTIFRSNHANNYYSLKGTMPQDTPDMIKTVEMVMENTDLLKPEWLRRLGSR